MIRAVILAAGRGSRMGQLTGERPKCLIELAGCPLLVRQIAALRRGGAERIGIVRGYRAEAIAAAAAGATLEYFDNPRWAETNMVASLAAAAAWLRSGPVIVSYGDIFYRASLVRALAALPGPLAVAYDRLWRRLWTSRFARPLSDAETFRRDGAGHLLEIGGPPARLEEIEGQYMGLLHFTPPAWRIVEELLARLTAPARDRLDLTGLLRRLLAARALPVATCPGDGQWGEVDQPSDIELYERMLRDGELELEPPLSASEEVAV
ncbi:MAG: NTP transferase domain-containing protein [Terriglobales bacterium]